MLYWFVAFKCHLEDTCIFFDIHLAYCSNTLWPWKRDEYTSFTLVAIISAILIASASAHISDKKTVEPSLLVPIYSSAYCCLVFDGSLVYNL